MSTEQLATFELAGRLYGVPVERVQEVLRPQVCTPVPLASPSVAGLINLRGQVVTALDLRRRMGLPGRDEGVEPMNVVIRTGDEVLSLHVDVIGEVLDVDESTFEAPPDTLVGSARDLLRGAYKLDGVLLLALDVDRLVATT